jgi:long-chain acyl-CoA synthetase
VLSHVSGSWGPLKGRFGHETRSLAAALAGYGLSAGSSAAVLGKEGYGTLRGAIAIVAAGATVVSVDPAASDDALRRALATTGAVHAIVSDERQLARILALRPELPALELILLIAASPSERKSPALLVPAAIEVGSAALAEDPDFLRSGLAEGAAGAACVLVDGRGDARPTSRAALFSLADALAAAMGMKPGSTVVSGLSVGSVERLGVALAALGRRATLLLPDPAARPDLGLGARPPDSIVLDVASLERLHRAWLEDIQAKSLLGRAATRWALRQVNASGGGKWKHRLAERVGLRGLRDKLGGRTSTLYVIATERGGASFEAESFFRAAGLTIRYFAPGTGAVLAR